MTFDMTTVDPEESALVCGGSMDVYIEPISPEPNLIIFGAGHISKALAAAGKLAGFRITIVDDRSTYANPERFPAADAFYVATWKKALEQLHINNSSFLFIATRGHQFDLICLRGALSSSAHYIGLLGSRKKAKVLFDILEKEGIDPSLFERVIIPAGFDIGSETPEEIAASIVVELIAVYKNRDIRAMRNALRNSTSAQP